MFKKYFVYILLSFASIILIGCGNPPEPYNLKLNKTKNVTTEEKQILLNHLVTKAVIEERLKGKLHISTKKDGCVYLNDYYGKGYEWRKFYKNCFKINNNQVSRIDKSNCYSNYGYHKYDECSYIGGHSEDYSNAINKIQENLTKNLKQEIIFFSIFKNQCLEIKKERKNIAKKIKFKIVDTTGVVPKKIINRFHLKSYLHKIYCIDLYNKIFNNNNNFYQFAINDAMHSNVHQFKSFLKDKKLIKQYVYINNALLFDNQSIWQNYVRVGRYEINFHMTYIKNSIDKPIKNLTFKIDKVYFYFVPENFILKDKNIFAKIINAKPDKHFHYNPDKFIIKNKTTQFMKIVSISMYYGNIVKKVFESNKGILISPKSEITLTPLNKLTYFPDKEYLLLKNKSQTEKYGVSIAYKITNENIIRTLYKVKKFTIKDFKDIF